MYPLLLNGDSSLGRYLASSYVAVTILHAIVRRGSLSALLFLSIYVPLQIRKIYQHWNQLDKAFCILPLRVLILFFLNVH